MLSNKHFFFCNCSLITAMYSFANRKAKQPRKDWHRWYSEVTRDVECCPSDTLQFRPPQNIPSQTLPPLLPRHSSCNHASFPKVTTCLFFWFFFHLCYTSPCGSLDSSSVFLHHRSWGGMTFGYKIMGSIHQTFGTALMVLSIENSSSAAFGSQTSQQLLGVCPSRNSSTANAWVLGPQKLSQCTLAAPVCLGHCTNHLGREAENELSFYCKSDTVLA